jgi:hypothetical protein
VAAEHDHNAAIVAVRLDDRFHHGDEVTRDEHVGQRAKECAEGSIVARSVREFLGANLVRPAGNGNGADRGEIRLVMCYGALGAIAGV